MRRLFTLLLLLCFAVNAGMVNRTSRARNSDVLSFVVLDLKSDKAVSATGTWLDRSPSGNDCVLSGDAAVTQGVGLVLDGDDWGTVAASATLKVGATTDFSIAFWVNTSASTGAAWAVLDYGDRSDAPGILARVGTDAEAQSYVDDNVSQVNVGSTTNPSDATWHHVAITYDRNGNIVSYIDGGASEDSTSMTAIGDLDTTDHDEWTIGRRWYSAAWGDYFSGTLDVIRFYNGVALSQALVQRVYDNGVHR